MNAFTPFTPVSYTHLIALESDLLSAAMLGIDNILCLTGDDTKMGDHPQAKPVFDLDSLSYTHLDVYKRQVKICDCSAIDLMIMDVQTFHNHDGLSAGKEIREKYPYTKAVSYTHLDVYKRQSIVCRKDTKLICFW